MIFLNAVLRTYPELRRVTRFLVVGVLGTLVDVGLFTLLRAVTGLPILAANTSSYCAGIVNNFALHRAWTYADRPRKAIGIQFWQFAAVSLSALVLNNLIVWMLAPGFGDLLHHPRWGELLAKGCATGVGMVWNFVANTWWTFRTKAGNVS